ncbi:MAG: class I SAM-dependent methyltransferase [Alphaproteobacteria bacterium]
MTVRFAGLAAAAFVAFGVVALPATAGHHELGMVLENRSDKDKARDKYRHPKETLEFFGVTHKSRVAEVLPGGGWYGRILLPLVADNGAYFGINYAGAMVEKLFPSNAEGSKKWAAEFPAKAAEWVDGDPDVKAWRFGEAPEDLAGTLDVVLFVRAAHHLNRAGDSFFADAAEEAFSLLKSGGVVGVVQHRAPADISDEWAVGNAGYVKQSRVVEVFKAAGFTLEAASEVNANPNDKPTTDDFVWRLPPSLAGDQSDEMKKKHMAIGESDRMTLKFVKP